MRKRVLLSIVLAVAGFVAGLVVTGRMRVASDLGAEPAPQPRAGRRPSRVRSALLRRPSRSRRRARFHACRRPRGQGRREHLVGAARSPIALAVRGRSVLQLLLRQSGLFSADAPGEQPRLGRHHLERRLRRHQQPRGRPERRGDQRRARRQTRGARPRDRHRSGRPTSRC